METLRNDANHTSVAKEHSTTFGDAQSHVQIRLSAEGGHILRLAFLSPAWGTHLDRPDWWAWTDHTRTAHPWRCPAWWHLAAMIHMDSWGWGLTSDPPSDLLSGLWAALPLEMVPVAGTDSLEWNTRLCHTCSFGHWGLRSFPLGLDSRVRNTLMMRDSPIRFGTPVLVDMEHFVGKHPGLADILMMDIRRLVVWGSWEVVLGTLRWTCRMDSHCWWYRKKVVEDNGCLYRDLENWVTGDPRDPNADLLEIAGMGHLNLD